MKLKDFFYNRYLILSPIFLLYAAVIIVKGRLLPVGDGFRYWNYANNLLNGYFGDPSLEPGFLWSGPGYPILLTLFRYFDTPILIPTLLNSVFVYLGALFFSLSLSSYLKYKYQIIISFLLIVLNPTLLIYSTYLYTEPLVFFLSSFLIYRIIYKDHTNRNNQIMTGVLCGYIILVKIIFAYVFLTFLLFLLIVFLIKREKIYKNYLYICLIAFVICIPYQINTYNLTNRIFYWGDSGGDLLYSISSPYQIDLGQWQEGNSEFLKETIKYKYGHLSPDLINSVNDLIFENRIKNHGLFLESLNGLNGIEKNDKLIKRAIKNIRQNKLTFIKNWILNTSRLFIGYPYSLYFKPPNTPIRMVYNIFISSLFFWSFLFAIFSIIRSFSMVKMEIKLATFIFLIYLGGTTLLATQSQRFLIPATPLMLFIISFTLNKSFKFIK